MIPKKPFFLRVSSASLLSISYRRLSVSIVTKGLVYMHGYPVKAKLVRRPSCNRIYYILNRFGNLKSLNHGKKH